jgi:ribosome maturation factor RimP
MITKEIANQMVADFLKDTDYYLVSVSVSADNRIVVEIDAFAGVSIEVCEKLSRHIEQNLDRDADDYELEVSSAGLTEPFKVLKQYEKFISKEVEVLAKTGQKFAGILTRADENNFTINIEKKIKPEGAKRKIVVTEDLVFNYDDVKSTKYLLKF